MPPTMCNLIMLTHLHALHKEVRFRKTEALFLNQPIKVLEIAGWFLKVWFPLEFYWVPGYLGPMCWCRFRKFPKICWKLLTCKISWEWWVFHDNVWHQGVIILSITCHNSKTREESMIWFLFEPAQYLHKCNQTSGLYQLVPFPLRQTAWKIWLILRRI